MVLTPETRARLAKSEDQHKYDHGHALVVSGGVGHGGAARLAARGALRIGAGLVTLGCPPAAILENAAHLNAIMLARIDGADALTDLLQDKRLNALCIGPGLGLSERAGDLLEAALAAHRATVLDADALTLLSKSGALFSCLHSNCVLTPHRGEFARLFPELADLTQADTLLLARQAAARAGCTVLLKGPVTAIAEPEGICATSVATGEHAAPWLATAGSGDVLAGFITGLLARGFAPRDAAASGAWLHAECARHFGAGLIAEDLPETLPAVFRELGL